MSEPAVTAMTPGVCIPWEEKVKEFPPIRGDEQVVRRVWEETDSLAYLFIFMVLEVF